MRALETRMLREMNMDPEVCIIRLLIEMKLPLTIRIKVLFFLSHQLKSILMLLSICWSFWETKIKNDEQVDLLEEISKQKSLCGAV